MILNVTVDVKSDEVADPANIITRITEALSVAIRAVDGVTGVQVTQVIPQDTEETP